MNAFHRLLGIVALGFFLSGCSGYRTMKGIPPQYAEDGTPVTESTELENGQTVRVIIDEWNNVAGTVAAHDTTGITLQWEEGDEMVEQPIDWLRVREVQIKENRIIDPGILILPAIVLMAYWVAKGMDESLDMNKN